jgi:hypothetical protein
MKRLKSRMIIFFFSWYSLPATAQIFTIQVVDMENGVSIPYATGRWNLSEEIIFSDLSGVFIVNNPNLTSKDTLFIHHVGFEPSYVTDFNGRKQKEFSVKLKSKVVELKGPTVSAFSPVSLMQKVKRKLKESIPKNSIIQPSFYRQFHIENNKGVFFLEALVSLNFGSGTNKTPKVKVDNLRRIPSSELNKEHHSDHLMDLLFGNPVYNDIGGPLHARIYNDFTWKLIQLPKDSSDYTQLDFTERLIYGVNVGWGSLIIRNTDGAILKYSTCFGRRGDYDLNKIGFSEKYIWLKMEEKCEYEFEWFSDSVYLRSARQEYTHFLLNKIFHTVDHELKENFYWKAMGPFYINSDSLSSFKLSSNLYTQKFRVDRQVWNSDIMQNILSVQPHVLNLFGGRVKLEEAFGMEEK